MRYVLLIIMFFSLSSTAFATDTTAKVKASNVINVDFGKGTGATVKTEAQIIRLPSGKKSFKSLNIKYSVARLREMAKGKLNPAHVAAAALLAAAVDNAGFVLDELTGQISVNKQIPVHSGAVYCSLNGCARTKDGACSDIRSVNGREFCGASYYPISVVTCSAPLAISQGVCLAKTKKVPVSIDQETALVIDAFNKLTPAQQRLFFEDLAGNPAITPELAAALQAEADRLKAAEGLTDSTVENPNGESDASQKAQEVTIKDPVKIDGSDIDTSEPPNNDFPDASDYLPLTNIINALPVIPELELPNFGLSYTSGCRTINFDWNGASVPFPSTSQCAKLSEAKEIIGWFISVITMFGIAWLVLGNRYSGA